MITVFQILLAISIAGILFLVFRKIPVLLNYPRRPFEEISLKQKLQNRWREIKEQIGQSDSLHKKVIPQTEKFLRRLKVFVLKLDNILAKVVGKLRYRVKKHQNGGEDEGTPS
jgi:hypothetical protein